MVNIEKNHSWNTIKGCELAISYSEESNLKAVFEVNHVSTLVKNKNKQFFHIFQCIIRYIYLYIMSVREVSYINVSSLVKC